MYLRPAFVETDIARIVALIEAHPFGLLVTNGPVGAGCLAHPVHSYAAGRLARA